VSALESALCIRWVVMVIFLCVSSMSADSLWCHFGKEASRTSGFNEALPGVFVSPPTPFDAQETQHCATSLVGPRCVVSE
jgi:hypothetical protein